MPAPVAPITLTAAGLSPDRADRATFVARSIARDDFIKNIQIPQLQTAIDNVFNNATEAYNSGVSATANAASSAINASQAAAAAAAIQWVSGTTYAVGDARWSPATKISYRRLIAGAGTTDPSADATNWAAIVMPVAGGGTGSATPSGVRLTSIDYTLAANALTLKLNPCNFDFRSTTLASGAPVNVANAAQLTLTIPSGATLGLVNGVQSDLVQIVINNAGVMEKAVVNLAGGVNLDETGIISTTALSTTSNSANVIYSTTARTGVAYRVVGFFRSTQTTAGTWAQAPTLVQPVGGQALAAMASLGYGQTRVAKTIALNTTYYNPSSKPIIVSFTYSFGAAGFANIYAYEGNTTLINGVAINSAGASYGLPYSMLVLPYSNYRINATGTASTTIVDGFELR